MLAFGMNGEPLPVEHGFPVRMLIPGLYGYVSACKWVTGIEASTYDAYDAYWTERDWAAQAPIRLASRIDTPAPLRRFPAGRRPIAAVIARSIYGLALLAVGLALAAGGALTCVLSGAASATAADIQVNSTADIVGVHIVAAWATANPTRVAPMITAPPIVGVPRLVWCEVGPSSRMNWP